MSEHPCKHKVDGHSGPCLSGAAGDPLRHKIVSYAPIGYRDLSSGELAEYREIECLECGATGVFNFGKERER